MQDSKPLPIPSRPPMQGTMRSMGKRMSIRQRLKHTMAVVDEYVKITGQNNLTIGELDATAQAARFSAHQYRRRWIYTMVALILVVLAVGIGLV